MAAALTYWTVLGLFPAGIVVVSLVGLVLTDEAAIGTVTEVVGEIGPDTAVDAAAQQLHEVVAARRSTTGLLLAVGLAGALWTASLYLHAFSRAANTLHGVRESRPFYRLIPRQLTVTVAGLLLIATAVTGLVVSGPVARAVGQALGLEQAVVASWDVARWPVQIVVAAALLALLFRVVPDVPPPPLRALVAGGAVTLAVWGLASAGFGFYVSRFGTYDLIYGALGAVIVFLVWVFLTNCAVLLGVTVTADLSARARSR